jgi:transposase InsO family protein/transposase-like protein
MDNIPPWGNVVARKSKIFLIFRFSENLKGRLDMSKKRKKSVYRKWSVAEKLEAVQARQKGLTYGEIYSMLGVCDGTLNKWIAAYEQEGVAGLERVTPRNAVKPSPKVACAEQMLAEVTAAEPKAGIGKVQGALFRRGFLKVCRETVRRLLRRNGKAPLGVHLRRKNAPPKIRTFERANPNDLWQSDIMSFMLKGQYRVYLIGFMDDHSRFLVSWGLYRLQTAANVVEVFRAGIEKHGMPKEVLTDNGRQYYTWRGKSAFTKTLIKLGIRHIRSRPYHPQTLGKIESFWRNLFQECLSQVPLPSFEEAQQKIGEYIEFYNFKRPHQGIGNVYPADRFYRVEGQVRRVIEENTAQVSEAAPPLADYEPPAYLVGNLGGKELRVVAKSASVTLTEAANEGGEHGNGGKGGEVAESGGAIRADSGGPAEAGADREVVQAGGDLAGGVLPVDAPIPSGGADGAGGGEAGSETGVAGESGRGDSAAEGPDDGSGEKDGPVAEGTGSPETRGGGGNANHPETVVGAGSGGGV